MNLSVDNLPDDINELKQLVLALVQENQALLEELNVRRRKMFGRSAEPHPPQGEVFNEAEAEAEAPVDADASCDDDACEPQAPGAESLAPDDNATEQSEPQKPKKRRPRLPTNLPREEVVVRLPPEEQVCDCCSHPLHVMGEEVREELELLPAHVRVTRYIREKYGCRRCEQQGTTGSVKVAPPVPALFAKSYATPSLVTQIIINKFQFALPLYRQEALFAGLDIPLSRQTQSQWLLKVAERLKPLRALMHAALLEQEVIFADETPLNVLSQESSPSYMWLYGTGRDVRPAEDTTPHLVLYDYQGSRSGQCPAAFLAGYTGYLQVDGYAGYHSTEAKLVGCMAHARRKFEEAQRAQPNAKVGKAVWALTHIQKLYRIEKACQGKPPDEVYRRRQAESRPLMEELGEWLAKTQVLPKGYLGKAIGYCQKQWPKLMRYLEDGRLGIDNNRAERAIKPFVIGRKNWLFTNTEAGAHASALLYSLVESARINGLNQYDYLHALLTPLKSPDAEIDWDALLPWKITLP
ncbi:IS66 family transposase [Serratia liquefaciens]|uniref:IS66 family transposase n=1 Tax=Serratia liquefaciens TaxID=614 RepID=A0ABX7DDA5_SERLI|nr:IS66 family transposase [Serratia liquefaciens]QQU57993.1 IS66 family transposase [Serratia liquefaciens]